MDSFIGTISAFGFNFAPMNWALCQGQLIPIAQYTALFSLLGVQYGGNGTTNFGLPNLQGRAAIGAGQGQGLSPYIMGQTGGNENVTLNLGNLPSHTHALGMKLSSDGRSAGTLQTPANNFPGLSSATANIYSATQNVQMGATVINLMPTGGTAVTNIQRPMLVVNYCICMNGIFPPRS